MRGRYGQDYFGRFLFFVAFGVSLLSYIPALRRGIYIAYAILLYEIYRFLSRNISARYRENEKFLRLFGSLRNGGLTRGFGKLQNELRQRRTYCFFRCQGCGRKVRVPRGRGMLEITCPVCKTVMRRRT